VTVLEAIQRSADFLAKKGVDSPRLQAELLLAHALHVPRLKLYLDFQQPLPATQADALRELVRRRGRREPLQHILGSASFCGFELAVSGAALVPRPETELLAELGWAFLSSLNRPSVTALDFGTGSGCLAIALAANCRGAQITATDISSDALDLARQNIARHGLTARIHLVHSDGAAVPAATARFDLVISNPPYIPSAEIEGLQPEVRDFDPHTALDGGEDGLQVIRGLAKETGTFLAPGGRLMFEFGEGQGEAVREILTRQNWVVEAVREDYTHRQRFLIARR